MSQEPLEIRARTKVLDKLDMIQTGLYLEFSGEIDDQVYDALQAEVDMCIQGIKEVKV